MCTPSPCQVLCPQTQDFWYYQFGIFGFISFLISFRILGPSFTQLSLQLKKKKNGSEKLRVSHHIGFQNGGCDDLCLRANQEADSHLLSLCQKLLGRGNLDIDLRLQSVVTTLMPATCHPEVTPCPAHFPAPLML